MMKLGEQIRKARIKKGMTQEQLADMIGLTSATVSNYENGKNSPPYPVLYSIADALEIQVSGLLTNGPDEGEEDGSGASEGQTDKRPRRVKRLVSAFDRLNDLGQRKAIERMEELCMILLYQRSLQNTLLQYVNSRCRQTFTMETDREIQRPCGYGDASPGGWEWHGREMSFVCRTGPGYVQQWDFFYYAFNESIDDQEICSIIYANGFPDEPGHSIAYVFDNEALFDQFYSCYMDIKADYGTEFEFARFEAPGIFILLEKETWDIKDVQEYDPNDI